MKFALVTGTSRGIGAVLAGNLIERGWRVVGCARGAAPAGLASRDGYTHLAVDLADVDAVERTFSGDAPAFADLRKAERAAIVHNAAVVGTASVPATSLAATRDALTLNVATPIWMSGWFLRETDPDADVRIVEVSSGAATGAYPGWSVYCASKAALRMAGEVISVEVEEVESLQGRYVRVLSYAPGVVATAMQEDIRKADSAEFPRLQRFIELHEGGHLVAPEGPALDLAERLEESSWEPYEVARFQG